MKVPELNSRKLLDHVARTVGIRGNKAESLRINAEEFYPILRIILPKSPTPDRKFHKMAMNYLAACEGNARIPFSIVARELCLPKKGGNNE